MAKPFALILPLLLLAAPILGNDLEPRQQGLVASLIRAFATDDRAAIAKRVRYPLRRDYPVPPVKDPADLLSRFDQVFDAPLRGLIAHSSAAKDWDQVGWRGIMLGDGIVWIDDEGQVIAVNGQSQAEKELERSLIEKDRAGLHLSLRRFLKPVLACGTDRYRIRIDAMGDNAAGYRYAVWPKAKAQSEKPDLVLEQGACEFEGSGGNHRFSFKNGAYVFRVDVDVVTGPRSAPGTLEIEKDNKVVLRQDLRWMEP
jgi:hypothetical protein